MARSALAELKLAKLKQLRDLQVEKERRETERLRNLDVFGLLEYTPTPRQEMFHEATEFDVLYGGAAGGGKLGRSSWRGFGRVSAIPASV